jgi:hypothetical protein
MVCKCSAGSSNKEAAEHLHTMSSSMEAEMEDVKARRANDDPLSEDQIKTVRALLAEIHNEGMEAIEIQALPQFETNR